MSNIIMPFDNFDTMESNRTIVHASMTTWIYHREFTSICLDLTWYRAPIVIDLM